MKSLIAVAVAVMLPLAVTAKTVNSGQGNANERLAAGVAGPQASANQVKNAAAEKKKAAKKIKTPPPLHDPN
ncbi:MAG TPA: hypothetical protein VHC40_11970 [Rhizomicrobium sp.]|jgi:hypothetical protein|nr:hypothetical protein [Rhizomicrobium sp.]